MILEPQKPKGTAGQKRSLVVVESSSELGDDEVRLQPPAKKKSPLKQKVIDPASFFQGTGAVKQSKSTSVKVTKKAVVGPIDEFDDGDLLYDDLLRVVEEAEASQNVLSPKAGILTLKNQDVGSTTASKQSAVVTDASLAIPAIVKENVVPKKKELTPKNTTEVVQSVPSGDVESLSQKPKDDEKKPNKGAYFNYMKRKAEAPPINRVSRPLPIGSENCLTKKSFVFTGELVSLDRTQAQDIVKRYGGKTPASVSKNTSYIVFGSDPGPAKVKKAQDLNIKTLTEDEFYELVNSFGPKESSPATTFTPGDSILSSGSASKKIKPEPSYVSQPASSSSKGKGVASGSILQLKPSTFSKNISRPSNSQLWTDKYKPESYDQVIGNTALIQRLSVWLRSWNKNKSLGFPKGGKDDFSVFRAALLSGPPGIGKTTAAHLVAKLEGFEGIEFNASDTRSKKALENIVKQATQTRTVTDLFSGKKAPHKVIIMDEVDGMSAGDRGGSAELIQLIKKTSVPIICICNDHSSPKMRSLSGHCFDLKFKRATAASVEKRVKMIAAKEGLTLQPNVVGELVASTSGDIRQILNILSTYRLGSTNLSFDQSKAISSTASKNLNLTPFDVIGKLLGVSTFRSTSFSEKLDLYFQDFSLIPLFVQENYIKMIPSLAYKDPHNPKKTAREQLKLLSQAADSICDADILESRQRAENSWSLLPVHAAISTIRPCFFTHGQMASSGGFGGYGGGYSFPSWLGQNSKQSKTKRILREIQTHMRLLTSADKDQILLSYLPLLATLLTKPLAEKEGEGVSEVIALMDHYYLSREDWDSIMELGYQKLITPISTKTKTAFTRTFNKMNHPSPFACESAKGSSSRSLAIAEIPDCEDIIMEDEVVADDEDAEEEEVVFEKLEKKPVSKKGAGSSKAAGS